MPTGYTAAIADGISFEQFILNCARAFGACVLLRDEPGGGEKIPERFEVSSYHAAKLEEARKRLAELLNMEVAEADKEAAAAYATECTDHARRVKSDALLKEKYEAMLTKVEAWTPPTPDHVGLRDFMAQQIRESIQWDCVHQWPEPVRQTGVEWRAAQEVQAMKDIAYHDKAHKEEVDRTEGRNRWIAELRASLKPVTNMPRSGKK